MEDHTKALASDIVPSATADVTSVESHESEGLPERQRTGAEAAEELVRKAISDGFVLAPLSVDAVRAASNRKWRCVQVEKRSITFFHHDGRVYAMDSYVFDFGTALPLCAEMELTLHRLLGGVTTTEELWLAEILRTLEGGLPFDVLYTPIGIRPIRSPRSLVLGIAQPSHTRISLDTGEGLYMGLENDVKSKGVKQRVHPVRMIGDQIYVKVSFFEAYLKYHAYLTHAVHVQISKPKKPNASEIQSDSFQLQRG